MIHTLVGDPFRQWVETKMAARNQRIEAEQNLMVELDPEVLRVFQASTAISGKWPPAPANFSFFFFS